MKRTISKIQASKMSWIDSVKETAIHSSQFVGILLLMGAVCCFIIHFLAFKKDTLTLEM